MIADLIARLRAGTITPADLDAAADVMERMPAEVWRRAVEAAAQAADDMRASLWAETPSKYLSDVEALHEIAAAIRAMPLPDDLR